LLDVCNGTWWKWDENIIIRSDLPPLLGHWTRRISPESRTDSKSRVNNRLLLGEKRIEEVLGKPVEVGSPSIRTIETTERNPG